MAETLRELADRIGFKIGCCVGAGPFLDPGRYPGYAETVSREFNIITTENAMKFGPLRPGPRRYHWEPTEAILRFAQQHDIAVRSHTGLWHAQNPQWLLDGPLTRRRLEPILRRHIETVGQRFNGRIAHWDVVNEAIENQPGKGPLHETLWYHALGQNYIAEAFRWAHQAAPDVKLVFNDFLINYRWCKSNRVYRLVCELLDAGVPIHGVGFQNHLFQNFDTNGCVPGKDEMIENFSRFTALGLECHVTELDVALGPLRGTMQQKLRKQAEYYRRVLQACLATPGVTTLVIWGVSDAHTWIRDHGGRKQAPLIFEKRYRPKPAYHALQRALRSAGRG